MTFIDKVASYVLAPFQSLETFLVSVSGAISAFSDLQSKTAWLYLLTSAAIAAALYVVDRRNGSAPPPLREFLMPSKVYLHRSAIVDYKFVAVDLTIKLAVYTPLITGFAYLVYKATAAPLAGVFGERLPVDRIMGGTPAIPVLAILAGDFAFFLSHYLMHKVRVLWYFHEVHHSAEVLTPVTVYRTHPVEDLVNGVVAAVISGTGSALYTSTTGNDVSLPAIFGINVIQFTFFSFAFQLRHSHIWLSYGPFLSRIFISPAQHQIHHSTDPKHWDKNFGFMLAIWDGMFGCLYVPKERETLQVGIPGADPHDFSSVAKLYFLPFAKAARFVQAGVRRRLETAAIKRS